MNQTHLQDLLCLLQSHRTPLKRSKLLSFPAFTNISSIGCTSLVSILIGPSPPPPSAASPWLLPSAAASPGSSQQPCSALCRLSHSLFVCLCFFFFLSLSCDELCGWVSGCVRMYPQKGCVDKAAIRCWALGQALPRCHFDSSLMQVTSLSQFAWNFLGFSSESPVSQETPVSGQTWTVGHPIQ